MYPILDNRSISAISIATLLLLSMTAVAMPVNVSASHCTVTVTAPSSIQAAVDTASSGDIVCLDDGGGDFTQTVVFGPEDSGITLSAAHGASPVMDGTGLVSASAITLLDGVSDVTIENLEIRDYPGWRGTAVSTWDASTSNIIVRDNYIHDNDYNGILVGSEGGYVHDNWMVKNNRVEDNGFAGIELTNSEDSTIMENDVAGSLLGIIVQARNTNPESGLVAIDGVHVLHNTVDGAIYGIYILSFTGHPTAFTPISGASSLLTSVTVQKNTITDSYISIIFWAYNDAATAKNGRIVMNEILPGAATPGIMILERGSGMQRGTVENVKVVNNTFDEYCSPQVTNEGEATKLPPGGPFP